MPLLHGTVFESRCVRCNVPFEDRGLYEETGKLPHCEKCGAAVRPHIVWFGEMPLDMDGIYGELEHATAMLVIGTSGSVYPAAGFVSVARRRGVRTVYIGPEEPLNANAFDEILLGTSAEVLPREAS